MARSWPVRRFPTGKENGAIVAYQAWTASKALHAVLTARKLRWLGRAGGRLGGGVRLLGETRVRAMRCRGCFYAGEEKRTPERLNSSTMLRFVTVSDLGSRILLFNKYPSARNAGQQQQQSSRWHYADSQPLREQLCPRTCV